MIARRSRQSGVALVLVMWVAVILTVIAGSFIVERRTELLVVRNSISVARAFPWLMMKFACLVDTEASPTR